MRLNYSTEFFFSFRFLTANDGNEVVNFVMDWIPNQGPIPPSNTSTQQAALTNAINAFVNATNNLHTTTPTQTQQIPIFPHQHPISYPPPQHQPYYPYHRPPHQQPQHSNTKYYNDNNNNNNTELLNKIGDIFNNKMSEMKKNMDVLKDNVDILNKKERKYMNEDEEDDDDEDDDNESMKSLRERKRKKKVIKNKRGHTTTTPYFRRKVLWAAVNKQTASSVKLAKLLNCNVNAVLSALSDWKKKGMVLPHGHNGYKLINGLKLENIDLENNFIIKLMNEFKIFEWVDDMDDIEEDDDDDDDDKMCEYFESAKKAPTQLSINGKTGNTLHCILPFIPFILSVIQRTKRMDIL